MTQSVYTPAPPADFVLAFDLANAGVRGRLVRLDEVSARALSAHALPEAANRVLGETLALSALLGSTLKLDGRLTVQTQSAGPLDLVAADYFGTEERGAEENRPAGLRGFARLGEARFAALGEATPAFAAMTGAGSLAITIEPRRTGSGGGNAYQGIVALESKGIAQSAEAYFMQSEQLPTIIRLAAVPVIEPGRAPHWRAGGLMLQAIPEKMRGEDAQNNDDWRRLGFILETLEAFELIDVDLSAEDLLWRLFNEDEVRVQPAEPLVFRCDCKRERIAAVLKSYAPEEREGLADADGIIRAKCEFCARVHEIAPEELAHPA